MPKPPTRIRQVEQQLKDASIVDAATGEVIPINGSLMHHEPVKSGRPNAKRNRRHKVFALVDTAMAMSRLELTQQEGRVFWLIVGAVNPNTGDARITGRQIATAMDVSEPGVSRIIKSLAERHILEPTGERSTWVVNPWIAFYGSAEDWESATAAATEPNWSRAS